MSYLYRHGDRPLDGYTILRGVGRGGFGEVYYAISDGGREVALKTIFQNEEIELRGVRHCINLKSPHLVAIFDIRYSDASGEGAKGMQFGRRSPFVIMEYVTGPSLRQIIDAHPDGLGAPQVGYILRGLVEGLSYLHSKGIVHRDLKPANIFVEEGVVKIGDYGLAKFINASQRNSQTISVGTVHYMAPEIGSGNYQRSVDIYALGIILYELLTGRVPFQGESFGEVLMKHLTVEPDLSEIPDLFRPVVAGALAKSPRERFQTVEDLTVDLLADESFQLSVSSFNPSSFARCANAENGTESEPPVGSPSVPASHGAGRDGRERQPAADPIAVLPRRRRTRRALQRATRLFSRFVPRARYRGRRHRATEERWRFLRRHPRLADLANNVAFVVSFVWSLAVECVLASARLVTRAARAGWRWTARLVRELFVDRAPESSPTRTDAGVSPRPLRPGRTARFFWVFTGAGLFAAAASCVAIASFSSPRDDEFLFAADSALACSSLGLFAFHRGLRARRPSFWGRSLRPFLLAALGGLALISFLAAGWYGNYGGARWADESVGWFCAGVSAIFLLLVVRRAAFVRPIVPAGSTIPPVPAGDRPLPVVLRVLLVSLGSAFMVGTIASTIVALALSWDDDWERFSLAATAVAGLALGVHCFRQALRPRRGGLWDGVVRPLLLTLALATLAVCAMPLALGLTLGVEARIAMVVFACGALALGLATVVVGRSARRETS